MTLLTHGSVPRWGPAHSSRQWATIRGWLSWQSVEEGWSSGRVRWEASSGLLREALQFSQPWASGQTGGCVQQDSRALTRATRGLEAVVNLSPTPSLLPDSSGLLPGSQAEEPGPARHPVFGWPEGQLGWMSGSLSNDGWAGCGNLALRKLPTKICLLLARTKTLKDDSYSLGPCPFLSEQRITFVW